MARYSKDGLRIATNVFEAAAWHNAVRVAGACGHVAWFDPHGLWWLLFRRGLPIDFRDLRERLYCTRCQTLSRRRVRPASVSAECHEATITLPMPDEREWKRAVNRFRS